LAENGISEINPENKIFCQKINFLVKKSTFWKNFWSKNQLFGKIKFLVKNQNYGQKFWIKSKMLVYFFKLWR